MGDSLLIWRISTLARRRRADHPPQGQANQGGRSPRSRGDRDLPGGKQGHQPGAPAAGSRSRSFRTPAEGKVLKNKTAEFRIAVTNTGDGPCAERDHPGQAQPWLAPRDRRAERGEQLRAADPGARAGPARGARSPDRRRLQGGEQWCRVPAKSTDVDFVKEAAEVERTIEVVEPKLKMTLVGPDKRFTDTVAPYAITLENLGTRRRGTSRSWRRSGSAAGWSPVPPGAKYDPASRRLQWTIPQIDPNEKASLSLRGSDGRHQRLRDERRGTGRQRL